MAFRRRVSGGPGGSSPRLAVALVAWLACASAAVAQTAVAETSLPDFKLYVEESAVYRVSFEDLVAAGFEGRSHPSGSLALTQASGPVPLWVEDGGDGVLGPGDWFEFLGERLRGEVSYLDEYTRYNVYFLHTDTVNPARMTPGRAPKASSVRAFQGSSHALRSRRHLEEDLLILRLPPTQDGQPEELWYWAKLVHNHREPFVQRLDLDDLVTDPGRTVDLRVAFRGWSRPSSKPPGVADHQVGVSLNGVEIATTEWSGTAHHVLEIPALGADRFVQGGNTLELEVAKRTLGEDGGTLIDVVMLNWIEIAYPRRARIGDEQVRLELTAPPESAPVRLLSEPDRELLAYGEGGWRIAVPQGRRDRRGGESVFYPPAGETSFVVTSAGRLKSPDLIVRDRPSRLADPGNRADYILIAHHSLLEATRPLADFHRSRGLEVEVVDVQDVYDEFNHGIVHPRALRSFLDHAYHRWARPAPRFVLLVGDASWDGKNARTHDANYTDWTYRPGETVHFGKNRSTPYASDAGVNRRRLIPTWNHATSEGHSASDNWFVVVDGDDPLPDMAIGRFPVVEPSEVARIVDKTVRYASVPEVGPWRRNVLFITNEYRAFQAQSDRLARFASAAGFATPKVYPASAETTNEHHSQRLVESFDEGQLLVHFFGHGGRYIWRTGPPDLEKNHDLFTLDHLDLLKPTGRLPVVLSMTCYSAPFDHPSADSIGEKLLRVASRGAVAVFAASWRNSPPASWGQVLLEELTKPGTTIGEAVLRAKHRIPSRDFIETYNLLGDPAVPVALPRATIALSATPEEGGLLRVRGEVPASDFSGRLIVDLVDGRGEIVATTTLELEKPGFVADFRPSSEELAVVTVVRAYAWDAGRGFDAAGAVELAATRSRSS